MSRAIAESSLYLITRGESTAENIGKTACQILELIEIAVGARVQLIQIREKNLSVRLVLDLARKASAIARGSATRILINDRPDIALAAGLDGVHLTSHSLSAAEIRRHFPADFLIGVSTHSAAEACRAGAEGADFAVFGPVFESPGKGEPKGIERLKELCDELNPFPIFALGGVDESNFKDALSAGARGISAIRLLNDPARLRKMSSRLQT